jgi:hypothetical protein
MPSSSLNSDFLSWWGAGLSTFLALVKLWEVWGNRFRLEISYNFTSSPEIGNEILIRNLSGKPIILTNWELLHRSSDWPFAKFSTVESAEHDAGDTKIEPHSTCTLAFVEAYHFGWSPRTLKGRSIVIRLWFAGRRPITRLVYPADA